MKKTLITGAAGFLGSHLVNKFLNKGHYVIGMDNLITGNLKNMFSSSIKNKIAYKIIENDIQNLKDEINPDKYNGAIFIGVNGISIKSHGSANEYAFSYAIEKCYKFIKNNINDKITNELNKL